MCHCLACQQRTGSVFGVQARFAEDKVTHIQGPFKAYTRQGDSGKSVTFHFCQECGSTVYWELEGLPGFRAVAVGAFADPHFGAPVISVYESRRHAWTRGDDPHGMEYWD